MIETIGTTTVGIAPISPLPGESRREAERRTAIGLLRALLDDDSAAFVHRQSGAPMIACHPEIYVSVSHSRGYAAVAIDRCRRIGIDIEETSRETQLNRVAERFLSKTELEWYSTRPGGLLEAWTMKESLYKLAEGASAADFRANIHLPHPDLSNAAEVAQNQFFIIFSAMHGDFRLTVAAEHAQ